FPDWFCKVGSVIFLDRSAALSSLEEMMSVGKSVSLVLGICFLCILLTGCEGDTGPIGPPGFTGTEGPPGSNFVPDPIADQVIGLMVVNAVGTDMNGAAKIDV